MPNMSNIVVKKADGTTDFTWTKISPAAGDGSFASWQGEGPSRAAQGSFRLKASSNGAGTARKVSISGMIPIVAVDPSTGLSRAVAIAPIEVNFTSPNNMLVSTLVDAVAIMTNTLSSDLVRECLANGVSPN